MELQSAIQLFLNDYLESKQYSPRISQDYKSELTRFEQFCRQENVELVNSEQILKTIDTYLHKRCEQVSPDRCRLISSRLRIFFTFLHQQGIFPQNLGLILPYLSPARGRVLKTELLSQIRELEQMLYDLKRIGTIRKRFSNLKKEVVKISKHNLPLQELFFKAGLDEISRMKSEIKDELDQQINELIWVGSIVLNGDLTELSNELSTLTRNVSKLGREHYKLNALTESKRDSYDRFSEQLLKRVERTEKFLEDLSQLKTETGEKIHLEFVTELLPVIDGLDEALASIPETVDRAGKKTPASKGFLKQFLSSGTERSKSIETTQLEQWFKGLQIIHKRLLAILRKRNVVPIKSIGEAFDPRRHVAVGIDYTHEVGENVIVEEHLKGYCCNNEIIRYAEVIVAKHPQAGDQDSPSSE